MQPEREVVALPLRPPPRLVDVKKQRPQWHPLDGLQQVGRRGDPLAGVVGDQARLNQVQFQARAAPGHAIQPPQPVLDRVDRQPAQGRRIRLPVGIDQAELLAQDVVAQRGPGPAGQVVGKLVEAEMVLQAQRIT